MIEVVFDDGRTASIDVHTVANAKLFAEDLYRLPMVVAVFINGERIA